MNDYNQYYNYLNNMGNFSNMNSLGNLNNMNNKLKVNNIPDSNKINQTSQSANNNIADPWTAFVRGNLFNSLYDQYKKYKPIEPSPSNEKEYALLMVQMYDFCAHELTLYLDNYPNDSNAIRLRDEYKKAAMEALNQYEMKYGPLSLSSSTLSATPWAWDTKTWPWEGNY